MNKKITLLILIVSITNTFSQNLNFVNKADKLIARSGSACSIDQSGDNLYVVNGFSANNNYTSEIEKYNLYLDSWQLFSTSIPTIAKRYGNMEIFGSEMYIFNGITNTGAINDKLEIINLNDGTLAINSILNPNPVYGSGSTVLGDNLISFGGCTNKFNATYSNKLYKIAPWGEWFPLAEMPLGLETKGEAVYGNGFNSKLYVFGGYKETNNVAENFETLTVGSTVALTNWINTTETGTKVYKGRQFEGNKYAEISAFSPVVVGQEPSNKVWLISNPFSTLSTDQVFLNFETKDGFDNGATLEPYLITNWTGDITTSAKTLLYGNISNGNANGYATNFTNSGNISLNGNLSNFRIGFKYTGGYAPSTKTTTYQIDNVRVYKAITSNNIYIYDFSSNSWSTSNTVLPQSISAYGIAKDDITNSKIYITGDYDNQTFTGVFDSSNETFTTLTQSNMIGRRHHNSEIWNNNLYIIGGNTDSFVGSVLESTQSADLLTLSSNNFITNSEIRIFPNPLKDVLNLSHDTTINTVIISNLLGQEILVKSVQSNESSIDISNLNSGTYFLKVVTNNLVKTFKVMKK